MKHLALILCLVGIFAITGCENDDFEEAQDDRADNGDITDDGGMGNVDSLQAFVLNNCNAAPSGDPVPINGASFPGTQGTDPANSVYTRRCMKS